MNAAPDRFRVGEVTELPKIAVSAKVAAQLLSISISKFYEEVALGHIPKNHAGTYSIAALQRYADTRKPSPRGTAQ